MAEKNRNRIIDGQKTVVKCSMCDCPLVEIWETNPELDQKQKIRAQCPYCFDKSYIFEVIGGFYLGFTDFAVYSDIESIDDLMLIKMIQGEKKWTNQ